MLDAARLGDLSGESAKGEEDEIIPFNLLLDTHRAVNIDLNTLFKELIS